MAILIPDTSSLINLREIFVGRAHITDTLSSLFDVRTTSEITRETTRHKTDFHAHYVQVIGFTRAARQRFHREEDYQSILLSRFAPEGNPLRNRGERFNCSLALYQVRKQTTRNVILLIDDFRARRGFIQWFEERFRITKVWSSLDLLLYIYLSSYPKWPLSQAREALRTVNAYMGGTSHDMLRRLVSYRRYLDDLNGTLVTLPRVRG